MNWLVHVGQMQADGKTLEEVLAWVKEQHWYQYEARHRPGLAEESLAVATRAYNWKTGAEIDGQMTVYSEWRTRFSTYSTMMSEELKAQLVKLARHQPEICRYREQLNKDGRLIFTFEVLETVVNHVMWGSGTMPFVMEGQ